MDHQIQQSQLEFYIKIEESKGKDRLLQNQFDNTNFNDLEMKAMIAINACV